MAVNQPKSEGEHTDFSFWHKILSRTRPTVMNVCNCMIHVTSRSPAVKWPPSYMYVLTWSSSSPSTLPNPHSPIHTYHTHLFSYHLPLLSSLGLRDAGMVGGKLLSLREITFQTLLCCNNGLCEGTCECHINKKWTMNQTHTSCTFDSKTYMYMGLRFLYYSTVGKS